MAKDNITTKVKKGVYGLAAKIGKDVREKGGVVGKIADVVEATGKAVKELAEEGVKTGKSMHEDIQKSGGYIEAAKRTGKTIADTVNRVYKPIEESFFTNGEFDREKAKAVLGDKTKAIKDYGERAYRSLSQMVSQGAEAIRKDFHRYIPTDEELKTKYSGIGEKYNGILFREHYNKCILFSKKAEKKIPKGTKYKAQILVDIKDSASGNADELVKFYINRRDSKKIKVAEKFLYSLHK